MTHVGYLVGGYGLTAAVLIGYVLRLRFRSRALARLAGAPSAAEGGTSPASPASTPPAVPPR